MRAHHRAVTEKKEDTTEIIVNSPTALTTLSTPVPKSVVPVVTSSPTSVIVSRPGLVKESLSSPPVPFSTIIRHTKSSQPLSLSKGDAEEPAKRRIFVDSDRESGDYLSRMVIRTSVISPNPEHIVGRRLSSGKNSTAPFDFSDPSRPSAFTRPGGITLNLAIA